MVTPVQESDSSARLERKRAEAAVRVRFAPRLRLVIFTLAILIPVAALGIVFPWPDLVVLGAGAAVALVALLDLGSGFGFAGGIEASMARVGRLSVHRRSPIEVLVRFLSQPRPGLRLGLPAASELGLENAEASVSVPSDCETIRVSWFFRPVKRGSYKVDTMWCEVPSALGLWSLRWPVPLAGELRVYSNLRLEGNRVAALFLRRAIPGWRPQRQVGRGRDFEKLREYLPGDSIDDIHWKATAKRGHPVTKVFQVERTQEVYAVVDASRLSGRQAGDEQPAMVHDSGGSQTLLERQINAALALGLAAERQGDLFGLITHAESPRRFIRARNGAAHFQVCRAATVELRPESLSPDFRDVCTFIRARLTKRVLLVFFTSLDDPALAESFVDGVSLIAGRHVVVVASPLPVDARPLFSGVVPVSVDDAYHRLGGHMRWQGLQDLGKRLQRHGVHLALLSRDELAAGAVSHYVGLKQRQVI